jgi:hypothetical protein
MTCPSCIQIAYAKINYIACRKFGEQMRKKEETDETKNLAIDAYVGRDLFADGILAGAGS